MKEFPVEEISPFSSADQIQVWAVGTAPLLAEEEERSRCLEL